MFAVLGLWMALWALPAWAAPRSGLDAALEAARQDWAAEQSAMAAERAAAEARRDRLAARLVELELRRARLDGRAADVAAADPGAWRDLQRSLRHAAEVAVRIAGEIPGLELERRRFEAHARALAADPLTDAAAATARWHAFWTDLDDLERAGRSAARMVTDLVVADGRRLDVELWRAGFVSAAYRLDGNWALRVAAPEDARGYRWDENLPGEWSGLFAGLAAPSSDWRLPLDPTGRLESARAGLRTGLGERLRSGGPIMLPLGAIALVALVAFGLRSWHLLRREPEGGRVAGPVLAAAAAGDWPAADRAVQAHPGFAAGILGEVLATRSQGRMAMEDAAAARMLSARPRLETGLGLLLVCATVAPLLGLLGTVTGIMQTFGVLRALGGAAPEQMAGGISEALMTTATGLAIAIPVLLGHAWLRGRVDTLVDDTTAAAAELIVVAGRSEQA